MIKTYGDAKKVFDRIEFRHPDWKVELSEMSEVGPFGDDVLQIRVVGTVSDARTFDPTGKKEPKPVARTTVKRVSMPVHEEQFVDTVRETIRTAWLAEADRWLQLDGVVKWNSRT